MLSSTFSINKRRIFILLFSILIVITSCTKDADNLTFVPPSIDNISPNSGPGDTEVTIRGIAFNPDIDVVSVFFNDQEATVNSVTSTEIKAIVPRGAQTGIVKVVINGEEALGPEFTYINTPSQVTTLIRSEMPGDVDGPVAQASFSALWGLVTDEEGSIYVSDSGNNKIRKIDTNGIVSTVTGTTGVTGSVDGSFGEATFTDARSMKMDADGNIIIVDFGAEKIRKINLDMNTVETIAGTGDVGLVNGDGSIAQFNNPFGIAIDASNNIYISEIGNFTIRKITPSNMVSTLIGTGVAGFVDGTPDVAQINFTDGMEIDSDGNIIFADTGNHSIRKVTPAGLVSTIAGTGVSGDVNGASNVAQFNTPLDVAIDSEDNIYVTDFFNNKIKVINPDGVVSTFAGTGEVGFIDGIPSIATFSGPFTIFIDTNDVIYITSNNSIRLISPAF